MLCFDCPRNCDVDRKQNLGFCREQEDIRIAKIIENFKWEEPCISGKKGALAIFFSGCNLRCQFCQNFDISHIGNGKSYSTIDFRRLLESYDMNNFSSIDLITPTHFSSKIIESLKGFNCPIPIVWNSSAYEKVEIIERLSEVVDVFLPDFKYYSQESSYKLSFAKDYFIVASKAISKMREMKPKNIFCDGVMQQGVLIRHLVLPGLVKDSFKILDYIKENIKEPEISLMSQFTPIKNECELNRKIYPLEYKAVVNHALNLGLNSGYIQDFSSANENFIPKF